jgi:hypothetical protein
MLNSKALFYLFIYFVQQLKQVINYLRYVLRFTSAWALVVFSIQRLFLVYSPFSKKFKSTKSGWLTVAIISVVSLVLNAWVPYLFSLQSDSSLNSCDVKREWGREYFQITIVYICLIMLFPITILFVSNFLIIFNLLRDNFKSADKNTKKSVTTVNSKSNSNVSVKFSRKLDASITTTTNKAQPHLKPYYYNMNQIINRVTQKVNATVSLHLLNE